MSDLPRRALLGLVYISVLVALIATSIGIYNKAMPWQRQPVVTLDVTRAGLSLTPGSDVKFQGVLVGEVRHVTPVPTGVSIQLAMDPNLLADIPADVDAQIVPKTLFGEEMVQLSAPPHPTGTSLRADTVLHSSTTALQVTDLLAQLEPILRSVDPAKLSEVLSALSQGLNGRGTAIAATINRLRTFLNDINPQLPTLLDDIRELGRTADVYAASTQALGRILDSGAAISTDLLVPHQQTLHAFLTQVINLSGEANRVLARNGATLISLTGHLEPVLALLNQYSSSLGCTISGLRTVDTLTNQVMGARGPFVNLTVGVAVNRQPYIYPRDLPSNPKSDANDSQLPAIVPGWAPHCPQFSAEVRALHNPAPYSEALPGQVFNPSSGNATQIATTNASIAEAKEALERAAAASMLNTPEDRVPGYADLLMAPLVSDGQVNLP